MKRPKQNKQDSDVILQIHSCGFPLYIVNGKLVKPELQVASFLSTMFSDLANSGEMALTGTVEVKVLAKKS